MAKVVPVDTEKAWREKLDRCGFLLLKRQAADKEPWRAELKVLLLEIQQAYVNHAPDLPIRTEGDRYIIDLSKRENERVVTNNGRAFEALKRKMGIKALINALRFTFKLIDEHIAPEDQATFVTQARTGSRDITAVLKCPDAA